MRRPSREFKADHFELETRLLLASGPASHPPLGRLLPPPMMAQFKATMPGTAKPTQLATQQDGQAIVTVSGYVPPGTSPLQVLVATDPTSPAVGVNVGAVNQTITFASGWSEATVTVPILAGAPNPGEVDVLLTLTPITPAPNLVTFGPLELRVMASQDLIPPKIISVRGTPRGIVLKFSKPMDPVAASDVNNYSVHVRKTSTKTNAFLMPLRKIAFLPPLSVLTTPLAMAAPRIGEIGISTSTSTHTVPLRAAQYDPATNSVTLVTRRKLNYSSGALTVTQGEQAKGSGPQGVPSSSGPGLTDLAGNPINGWTTPGRFMFPVFKGTKPLLL